MSISPHPPASSSSSSTSNEHPWIKYTIEDLHGLLQACIQDRQTVKARLPKISEHGDFDGIEFSRLYLRLGNISNSIRFLTSLIQWKKLGETGITPLPPPKFDL